MNYKYVVLGVVVLGGAVAIGRFSAPSKVTEVEKIVYKDKIVEKVVTAIGTEKKNNKVTIKLVKILPDGTKTIETKTYDQSVIEITQNQQIDKQEQIDIDKSTKKVVEYNHTEWLLSAGIRSDNSYGLFVNKRIIGPFYLGAFGFTDKSFGASMGVSF